MNYSDINDRFQWHTYAGQMDSDVTYMFVLNQPVGRLAGSSDILYIGKTEQSIRARYEQETKTKNSPGNTQQTNIRTTFVFGKIGLDRVRCYYVKNLTFSPSDTERETFMDTLRTWDKKSFIALSERARLPALEVSLEKYLLVRYASEHFEVPPMNNRM